MEILPRDEHNLTLLEQVRPSGWINPRPKERYNLVVIGAGTAGLVSAAGAAGLGAKVALVERHLLGGDCLNVGCVPSKALIRCARAAAAVRDASQFGVRVPPGASVDFSAVMQRMRRLRATLAPNDSADRFRGLGVDVFFGSAGFTGHDRIAVGDQLLRFQKAIIATGARPARPSIPGLTEAGYLTNETVFSLTDLPARLAVIGAGPIGCELAQAFALLGARVTLIARGKSIMPKEDPDAAERVATALRRDGVELLVNCQVAEVQKRGTAKVLIHQSVGAVGCHAHANQGYDDASHRLIPHAHASVGMPPYLGDRTELEVDEILVGVGRVPNVDLLALDDAGIEFDAHDGVKVNDRLSTTNPRVFAAGDVCSRFKFTHAADALARIAIQNALFFGRARASALCVPWCTYTSPEVAHVGLQEQEARELGIPVTTFHEELARVDRAVLDGETEGFVKVHVRKGTDRIVGATVVASHAGDIIAELTLAMTARVGLSKLARTIHPYPTQGEAIKRVADSYNRTRLTPRLKALLEKWFAWRR